MQTLDDWDPLDDQEELVYLQNSGLRLYHHCKYGNVDVVKRLLRDTQINVNWEDDSGWTPFFVACGFLQLEIMELLMKDERVDLNRTSWLGWTPFCASCLNGYTHVVEMLLNDERIDVKKEDNKGQTPFYIACAHGYTEIVKLLLNDKRIDVIQAKKNGETPFYSACENGYIEIVELLINDKRVDINKANSVGWTPFFAACDRGHVEVVKLLLACGGEVDLNIKNNEGETAIETAKKNEKEGKSPWETESHFEERKRVWKNMIEIIELFERNPIETRIRLGIQFGLAGLFIYLFIYLLFIYLQKINIFFFKKKKNISRSQCCFSLHNDGTPFRQFFVFEKPLNSLFLFFFLTMYS